MGTLDRWSLKRLSGYVDEFAARAPLREIDTGAIMAKLFLAELGNDTLRNG